MLGISSARSLLLHSPFPLIRLETPSADAAMLQEDISAQGVEVRREGGVRSLGGGAPACFPSHDIQCKKRHASPSRLRLPPKGLLGESLPQSNVQMPSLPSD